ncbi:MAG: BrnT family toxin [Alphaproteobacteria bacterium]|nr:BrnT family toxin [Alphaproteobacteria bacterium]
MFEWDETRRAENLASQGIDFVRAARMFGNPVLVREDTRQFHGETRFITVGHANGCFMVVVWTLRGKNKRIVSAWKADRDDETFYRSAIPSATRAGAGSQPGRRALPGQSRAGLLAIGLSRLSLPKPQAHKAETG